jgi:lysophospholipase L1-like esterase
VKRFYQSMSVFFLLAGILCISVFGQPQAAALQPGSEAAAAPRPSAEEVKLAEKALGDFLKAADPSVQEINRKYPNLIAVRVPPANTAKVPRMPFFQMQPGSNQSGGQQAQTPAAVPAVVAIPRPSAKEVESSKQALAKFLESADPAVKEISRKYPDLISVKAPSPNSAIIPNLAPFFQQKHQDNLEVAKKGDINVLFMGDSITDFWRGDRAPYAGKPVFDKYFGDWKVANFGIAGDTTQGVLYRLQHGEGQGFSPKAVMLMIGTNNTGGGFGGPGNTAEEIAEGIGAVVLELEKDFPKAKILLLAVFPRNAPGDPVRATIAKINTIISKLDDGDRVHYLDIGDKFLDAEGNIPKDVMSDSLHPTTKGYEIWAQAVIGPLENLMK